VDGLRNLVAKVAKVAIVSDREFKVQVMETDAQWQSGLRHRLELGVDGLSLFLNPSFDSWSLVQDWPLGAGDIVVDECGQTYWTALELANSDQRGWTLLRLNPTTGQVEQVLNFGDCVRLEPRELWLTPDFLWIFDHGDPDQTTSLVKGRILGLSTDNFQIVQEFEIDQLIDIDFDRQGSFFFALINDNGKNQVCSYSTSTQTSAQKNCFTLTKTAEPVALAVGKDGNAYVLDAGGPDDRGGKIVRCNLATKEETILGLGQREILKGIHPSAMQIDDRGVIFVAAGDSPNVYMFDADGTDLGALEFPSGVELVTGIGFDRRGDVYVATNIGLAKFMLSKNRIGQNGSFYSKTLDNGQVESFWHRIALKGRLPSKTSLDVYYYTSDSVALKNAYDKILTGNQSVEEKARQLDNLLTNRWVGPQGSDGSEAIRPETFKGADTITTKVEGTQSTTIDEASPDLILNPNKGRFLWFKLTLTTFDQKSRPSIRTTRIYYPRLSYLRYLPPAYREEPVSAAFLERFLSIFETEFEAIDQKIDQLYRYFDPRLAPKAYLTWLASWINLSLDEDLPEDRVRSFIRRAPDIYNRKGTPQALIEFLEIYTGKPVHLTEYLRGLRPLVIGQKDTTLGSGTVLLGRGPSGMRVGDTTVVGYSAVRDRVSDPDEPFLPLARRFTVLLEMGREEFERRKATLQRIITEQAPTHTSFTMRLTTDQTTVGKAVLGVTAVIHKPQPYRVGLTQLGAGSALARGPRVVRLERGAWVGSLGRV
jgi:phage tail-like protein